MDKINLNKRKKIVLAMEYLVRSVNDEELIMDWLMNGVADGDINSFDIDEVDGCYVEDNEGFANIMGVFLDIMSEAKEDGGLYVDGVVSK